MIIRQLYGAALAIGLLATPVLAIDPSVELADPAQQALYEKITNEVRCLVCQNQTVADSTAPLAADLRREIRVQVEAGKSEEEVRQFVLDRYGDFALYRPRFTASTALLWLAPLVLLLIGGTVLWRVVRHRASLPMPPDEEPGQPAA